MAAARRCLIRCISWLFWNASRRRSITLRSIATGRFRRRSSIFAATSKADSARPRELGSSSASCNCSTVIRSIWSNAPSWRAAPAMLPPSPPPWNDWPATMRCHSIRRPHRTSQFRFPICLSSIACCPIPRTESMTMNDANALMLKANLKQLRLPTMLAEWEKLAREAAVRNESYDAYLLQLTELEVASRSANAVAARIRAAGFPAVKDFDTFDFTTTPNLPKQKILELTRGEWIDQHFNCCLIGGSGTGKTQPP